MIRFHPQILATEIHRQIANAGMLIVPDGHGGGLIVRRTRTEDIRPLPHPANGSRTAGETARFRHDETPTVHSGQKNQQACGTDSRRCGRGTRLPPSHQQNGSRPFNIERGN